MTRLGYSAAIRIFFFYSFVLSFFPSSAFQLLDAFRLHSLFPV